MAKTFMGGSVKRKILILCPHTDDGEFGCGGTIVKFLNQGHDIHYCAFSTASKSIRKGLDKNILIDEMMDAMNVLGVKNTHRFDYDAREFPKHRQSILEDMIWLKKEVNPSIVFLPSTYDIHQDHKVVCDEGTRAFKNCTIFGYELPWNNLSFSTQMFVALNREEINAKWQAIEKYKSQSHRSYFSVDYISSWAGMRGNQIGTEWAETFEVIRLIINGG